MTSARSLPPFDVICFDCDSTLTTLEGIDELAVRAGIADKIVPLTTAAMDGTLTIDQVYAKRLELIRPDAAALAWVGQRYVDAIVPGAKDVIASLITLGKPVHIISGGLLQPVLDIAKALGVPADCVHAVPVMLDAAGNYAGFDATSPLAQKGGKATVCREIGERYGRIALVGDGVTDLEARDGGAAVIGFGGVVARPLVKAGADVFITSANLTAVLPALLTTEELANL
ncbi:MAG: HAD-IB family phosphatase [Hyphomicrobiaceae bacterium]